MQKNYLRISLAFNVVVILTFIFFTFIFPHFHSPKNVAGQKFTETLSAEQRQILDSLSRNYNAVEYPLRVRNIENRLRLWELIMQEPLDTMEISRVLDDLIAGENAQRILRYDMFLKEKYILSAEQRQDRLQPAYLKLKTYFEGLKSSRRQP